MAIVEIVIARTFLKSGKKALLEESKILDYKKF